MSLEVETTKLTKIEEMDTDALVKTMKQLQREVSKRQNTIQDMANQIKQDAEQIRKHSPRQQWEAEREAAEQQREAKRQERDKLEGINSAKRLERETHVKALRAHEQNFLISVHHMHKASVALAKIDKNQNTAATVTMQYTPMPGQTDRLAFEEEMGKLLGAGQVYGLTLHLELCPEIANLHNLNLLAMYLPKLIQMGRNFDSGIVV